MYKLGKYIIYHLLLILMIVAGCKKDDEPMPEDIFVGEYLVQEVVEEYNPTDPDRQGEKFLAPDVFTIVKSDFLNPTTGEKVTSYKFFIDTVFLGLSEQIDSNGLVIVGTQGCPNIDDLSGVSVTSQESGLYRLNMLNCIGREVLADYSRTVAE